MPADAPVDHRYGKGRRPSEPRSVGGVDGKPTTPVGNTTSIRRTPMSGGDPSAWRRVVPRTDGRRRFVISRPGLMTTRHTLEDMRILLEPQPGCRGRADRRRQTHPTGRAAPWGMHDFRTIGGKFHVGLGPLRFPAPLRCVGIVVTDSPASAFRCITRCACSGCGLS